MLHLYKKSVGPEKLKGSSVSLVKTFAGTRRRFTDEVCFLAKRLVWIPEAELLRPYHATGLSFASCRSILCFVLMLSVGAGV